MVAAHIGKGVNGRSGNPTLLDNLVADVQVEICQVASLGECAFRTQQRVDISAPSGYRLKQEPTPADRIQ